MKNTMKISYIYPDKMDPQMKRVVESLKQYEVYKKYGIIVQEYSYPEIDLKNIILNSDLIYIVSGYASNSELMLLHKLSNYLTQSAPPLIYGLHNPLFPYYIYRPKLLFFVFRSLLRYFLLNNIRKRSKLFIHALNTFEYNLSIKLGFNAFLIPPGVDTQLFKPSKKYDEFTIFFSGLSYRKGADVVLNIISALDKIQYFKARFIITYGAVALPELLHELKKVQYKVKNINMEIYDFLSREKIAEIISKSHILLFPSKLETWGRIVLESVSSGTPVIGFDIPGAMHDVVKRFGCGYAIKPFSTKTLLRKILYMYITYRTKPSYFLELQQICRKIGLMYDEEILFRKYISVLKSII